MKSRSIIVSITLIACFLMGSLTALATSYTSVLDISVNSFLEGSTRSYDAGVHNIEMTVDYFHTQAPFGSSVDVAVVSKNSLGQKTTHVTGTLDLPQAKVAYDTDLGYVAKGNYFYTFSTQHRLGFYADPVVMSSN